jgi:hypothetical protein
MQEAIDKSGKSHQIVLCTKAIIIETMGIADKEIKYICDNVESRTI